MTAADHELRIGTQEMRRHRDAASVRQHAVGAPVELLDEAEYKDVQRGRTLRYPLEAMIAERRAGVTSSERPFSDDFAPVGYMDQDRRCRAARN
jgi:hypothetical protein